MGSQRLMYTLKYCRIWLQQNFKRHECNFWTSRRNNVLGTIRIFTILIIIRHYFNAFSQTGLMQTKTSIGERRQWGRRKRFLQVGITLVHLSSSWTSPLLPASSDLGILCSCFCVVAVIKQTSSSGCLPTKAQINICIRNTPTFRTAFVLDSALAPSLTNSTS